MSASPAKTYEDLLHRLALEDERLVVMTAENRAVIRGLPAKLGSRFIDVGIAEQTMIGTAAGLALRGRRPVVHALASFLTMRAFEFIRTDLGIPKLPVILVGGFPGFLSEANGATHQAIEDVAIMRGIPGMGVFCPSGLEELLRGFPAVLAEGRPCYVRYNGLAFPEGDVEVVPGKARVLASGDDAALLTYGVLTPQVLQARALLAEQGISARVINMRFLDPVDEEVVLAAARETRLLVTIEDHFRRGGLRTIVDDILSRGRVSCPVASIDLQDRWFQPALYSDVLEHEGFTASALAQRISEEIGTYV